MFFVVPLINHNYYCFLDTGLSHTECLQQLKRHLMLLDNQLHEVKCLQRKALTRTIYEVNQHYIPQYVRTMLNTHIENNKVRILMLQERISEIQLRIRHHQEQIVVCIKCIFLLSLFIHLQCVNKKINLFHKLLKLLNCILHSCLI